MRPRTREWPGSSVVSRGSFLRLVLSLLPLLGCAPGASAQQHIAVEAEEGEISLELV